MDGSLDGLDGGCPPGETSPVAPNRPLIGRSQELADLNASLADAQAGRGALWFLRGEPGIGKSRLAEELTRAATERGFATAWGRCWEAGGAPAYWPFIQILRALARGPSAAAFQEQAPSRAQVLEQLVPECLSVPHQHEPLPTLEPDQERFRLLDAIAGLLGDVADHAPVLLILEDLHAVDASSALLLEFLAGQLRTLPVVAVGTYREADAQRRPEWPTLSRVAASAQIVSMRRLDRTQTRTLVAEIAGAGDDVADTIWGITEGNPLFCMEMARGLAAHGTPRPEALALPPSVRAAIRERLHDLPPPTRALAARAAVVGRDFTLEQLAHLSGEDEAQVSATLGPAVATGSIAEVAPGSFRFDHILIREVLYDDLERDTRHGLHGAIADRLEAGTTDGVPWSEVAHHRFAASDAPGGIAAALQAANQCRHQLAFADAAQWLARALGALPPDADGWRRGDLLRELGAAHLSAGEIEAGRAACIEAAALARDLQDAQRLALAALEYGSIYVFASVDGTLVDLLREALDGLPRDDNPLRARVSARLAAALQPHDDPQVPFALARDAVAMARRLGDRQVLLHTIRAASSALMDLADPAERLALNREHIELAAVLGDRVEELRGHMRAAFDAYELMDLASAHASIDAVVRIARTLAQPHYAWRALSFRIMRATREGRFTDAARLHAEAVAVARRAGDPNASWALAFQDIERLALCGCFDDVAAAVAQTRELVVDDAFFALYARILRGHALARTGTLSTADAPSPDDCVRALATGDLVLLAALSRIAIASGDRALAARVAPRLASHRQRNASGGMSMMVWLGPVAAFEGPLAAMLGDLDGAVDRLDEAIAQTRADGGRPLAAWSQLELARILHTRARPGDHARALACLGDAESEARELDMPGLLENVRVLEDQIGQGQSLDPAAPPPSGATTPITLVRDGEGWSLAHDGTVHRLKHTKGVAILARLVAEPGREFHVLDLAGAQPEASTGDAGEWLDEEARRQYRTRAEALRDALAEAQEFGDLARAEKAQAELEALEAELSRAVGLGGRARRAGSASERARVNVQRRIRDALNRISALDAVLARRLDRSVRTGTYCCYDP